MQNSRKDVMIGTWAWGSGYNGSSMVFGNKQDEIALAEAFDMVLSQDF